MLRDVLASRTDVTVLDAPTLLTDALHEASAPGQIPDEAVAEVPDEAAADAAEVPGEIPACAPPPPGAATPSSGRTATAPTPSSSPSSAAPPEPLNGVGFPQDLRSAENRRRS